MTIASFAEAEAPDRDFAGCAAVDPGFWSQNEYADCLRRLAPDEVAVREGAIHREELLEEQQSPAVVAAALEFPTPSGFAG